jgi:hypothetical protein
MSRLRVTIWAMAVLAVPVCSFGGWYFDGLTPQEVAVAALADAIDENTAAVSALDVSTAAADEEIAGDVLSVGGVAEHALGLAAAGIASLSISGSEACSGVYVWHEDHADFKGGGFVITSDGTTPVLTAGADYHLWRTGGQDWTITTSRYRTGGGDDPVWIRPDGGFEGAYAGPVAVTVSAALAGDSVVALAKPLCFNLHAPLVYDAEGDNLHFEIQWSMSSDFSDAISYTTSTAQNNWSYYNGTSFDAFPAGGLPSTAYGTNGLTCVVFDPVETTTEPVHVRARAHDGTDWGDYRPAFGEGTMILGN